MVEFDVELPRRLHLASEKSRLNDRSLPQDCSFLDGYEDLIGSGFGVTWLTAQEFPLLQNDKFWLTVDQLERVLPPDGLTEIMRKRPRYGTLSVCKNRKHY